MMLFFTRNYAAISKALERLAKLVAAVLGVVALISFIFPPFGNLIETLTAWRFGAVGYVYYEIDNDLAPTTDGNLYLLADGGREFTDLRFGNKLQATMGRKYFRTEPKLLAPIIFMLKEGDCVLVLATEKPTPVTTAKSGGWAKVATSGCGLFG